MIPATRFRANKALDFKGWGQARRTGITATEVANASTPAGFDKAVARYYEPEAPYDNPYMQFGREAEGPISLWLKDQFEILPNEWLLAHDNPRYLATPDGISLDHHRISEIKTTGKDFADNIPISYRRQVQWQLFVTGAEYCVFAWMLRVETRDGGFQPGWIEPKTTRILPSADTIEDLIAVADRLWEIKRNALGTE